MTKTTIKTVSLVERIEAVKASMRESGYSFASFIYEGIRYIASLDIELIGGSQSTVFRVKEQGSANTVYKTLSL